MCLCKESLQDSCCARKHKVPGTITEAFGIATEFANQEAYAGAGSSAELVSVKDARATAQGRAKEAQEKLASLWKKQGTFENCLLSSFNKAQAT